VAKPRASWTILGRPHTHRPRRRNVVAMPTSAVPTEAFAPTFLSGLSNESREELLAIAQYRRVPAKEVLLRAGEKATLLFLLHSGTAKYYRITTQGQELLLRWLIPGDVFGLGTLLKHPPDYMGSAQTLEECEIYSWTNPDIRKFLKLYPQLGENALRIALSYLSGYAERHSSLLCRSAEQRVARCLLNLGNRAGHHYPGGAEVDITNEQLGSLSDVGLFTVSRILNKWERSGAIGKLRGRVFIKVPEKLITD
jgi:CRP/FNR family transcriptional regulator, nitrogen oxide reductase regulator